MLGGTSPTVLAHMSGLGLRVHDMSMESCCYSGLDPPNVFMIHPTHLDLVVSETWSPTNARSPMPCVLTPLGSGSLPGGQPGEADRHGWLRSEPIVLTLSLRLTLPPRAEHSKASQGPSLGERWFLKCRAVTPLPPQSPTSTLLIESCSHGRHHRCSCELSHAPSSSTAHMALTPRQVAKAVGGAQSPRHHQP
jgi:hypothetical protein